ncbi:MAG: ion transporter [Pseudomonadota bacterium]
MGIRSALYREMEPVAREKPGLSSVNRIIVLLVLASFLLLALETEPTLPDSARTGLWLANFAILVCFAVEYVLRLWIAGEDQAYRGVGGRIKYVFTPFALADLVAFAPELTVMIIAPQAESAVVGLLPVLRLARLIKLARFVPAFDVLGATIRRSGGQLLTTLAMALALVYIAAVVLYYIEGVGQGREEFGSIPRAVWWAIATLTTVGYGDIYPVTTLGKIAASFIALAGIGVVALPAGVFASAFSDELRERERQKRETHASRSRDRSPAVPTSDQPSGQADTGVTSP